MRELVLTLCFFLQLHCNSFKRQTDYFGLGENVFLAPAPMRNLHVVLLWKYISWEARYNITLSTGRDMGPISYRTLLFSPISHQVATKEVRKHTSLLHKIHTYCFIFSLDSSRFKILCTSAGWRLSLLWKVGVVRQKALRALQSIQKPV